MHAVKWYDAKGDVASRLRQRKYALLRGLHIPPDALPGSLALTHRRCGTPTCWCAKGGDGHPMRSEEHTSELQSRLHLVCRLLLEKKHVSRWSITTPSR